MAHFALIDENNTVEAVHVIHNDAIGNAEFPESEPLGQAFMAELGKVGRYVQCSYNGTFRGQYPGPGWTYDPELDTFVDPVSPVAE